MTSTDRAAAEDSHRRRGPRPGRANHGDDGTLNPTQEAILEAARSSFLAQGFAKTTIRGVAREAGVDPALVS